MSAPHRRIYPAALVSVARQQLPACHTPEQRERLARQLGLSARELSNLGWHLGLWSH